MTFHPIQLLAPHFCCSCGEIGAILCESCFYDIASEPESRCLSCLQPVTIHGRCRQCALPYSRAWAAGVREDALQALINLTKFESTRDGCKVQARLIDQVLPVLPESAVFVPVPTIRTHVRRRGFDHAQLIARELAKRRSVQCLDVVERIGRHVQHGTSRSQRRKQAAESYRVKQQLSADMTYIIIDDVYTTGYTAKYVARALRGAGAGDVWVAVTARQPWSEPRLSSSDTV